MHHAPDVAERTGARRKHDLAHVVVVVLQGLLAQDHIPAAGNRRHDEIRRSRLGKLELDRIFVAHIDLGDRLEQNAAWNADAFRWPDDAIERRLHIICSEVRSVAELHPLPQKERIGLAVLGNLPAVREIGDDGLAAATWIAPDQVIEHACHGTEVVVCA